MDFTPNVERDAKISRILAKRFPGLDWMSQELILAFANRMPDPVDYARTVTRDIVCQLRRDLVGAVAERSFGAGAKENDHE